MRLLHVSDLHFREPWLFWVLKHAAEYDCVCVTGDLLDAALNQPPLANQAVWVTRWLKSMPPGLCVCSGNHDWWPPRSGNGPGADLTWLRQAAHPTITLDGQTRDFARWRIISTGWNQLLQIPEPTERPVILLSHAPPYGTDVSATREGEDFGDFEIRSTAEILPTGSIILSGHTHTPRRWFARVGHTLCLNPGTSFGFTTPNHIVIDTDRNTAVRVENGRESAPILLRRDRGL